MRETEVTQPRQHRRHRFPRGRSISDAEIETIINRSVDASLTRLFREFGVDFNNTHDMADFRADIRFNHRLREMFGHGIFAAVASLATLVIGAILLGIKDSIMGRPQ